MKTPITKLIVYLKSTQNFDLERLPGGWKKFFVRGKFVHKHVEKSGYRYKKFHSKSFFIYSFFLFLFFQTILEFSIVVTEFAEIFTIYIKNYFRIFCEVRFLLATFISGILSDLYVFNKVMHIKN